MFLPSFLFWRDVSVSQNPSPPEKAGRLADLDHRGIALSTRGSKGPASAHAPRQNSDRAEQGATSGRSGRGRSPRPHETTTGSMRGSRCHWLALGGGMGVRALSRRAAAWFDDRRTRGARTSRSERVRWRTLYRPNRGHERRFKLYSLVREDLLHPGMRRDERPAAEGNAPHRPGSHDAILDV
jgi:hypothetical protein